MSKPTAPSVGTRLLYWPAATELPGGNTPSPALVNFVGGSAPDYIGMSFTVFSLDGVPRLKSGIVNISTWSAGGSDPSVPRWDYVDLSA